MVYSDFEWQRVIFENFYALKLYKIENSKYWSSVKQWAKDPLLMPEKSNGTDLCDYIKKWLFSYSYIQAIQMCID